jgi:hypothetical protein
LGYALEGWAEAPGRPLPKRPSRLPRTSGGPLVVCLDTSHSMACMRSPRRLSPHRSAGRMFGHVPFDGRRA